DGQRACHAGDGSAALGGAAAWPGPCTGARAMRARILLSLLAVLAIAGGLPRESARAGGRPGARPGASQATRTGARSRPVRRPPARPLARGGAALGGGLARLLGGGLVRQGRYATGVPTRALVVRAAPEGIGRQRMSQWCWAASSQMILNYIGLPVSQEAVITRAYGGYLDRPATPEEIALTLNGWRLRDGAGGVHTVLAR